jgi:hypothetical protein
VRQRAEKSFFERTVYIASFIFANDCPVTLCQSNFARLDESAKLQFLTMCTRDVAAWERPV